MSEHWRLVKEGKVIVSLIRRPNYCDRGRYHAHWHTSFWRSEADTEVRYYFDLERGQREVEAYAQAKKINLDGAVWEPDVEPFPDAYQQAGLYDPRPRCDKQGCSNVAVVQGYHGNLRCWSCREHANELEGALGEPLEIPPYTETTVAKPLRDWKGFDEVAAIMSYEAGQASAEDEAKLFQYLVDTGRAWELQGHYGRHAREMIDAGYVSADKTKPPDKPLPVHTYGEDMHELEPRS